MSMSIDAKKFAELNEVIKDNITVQSGTEEMRRKHTEMLIRCSAGDKNAKEYVKSLIHKNLIEEGIRNEDLLHELTDKLYQQIGAWGILISTTRTTLTKLWYGTKILIQKNGVVQKVPEEFNSYDEVIAIIRRCLNLINQRT